MSAIEELKNKGFAERDAVERAIVAHWEDWHLTDTNVIQAEKAAEEYAALKARVSELEGWKEDVDLTLKWTKEYFEEKHAEKIKYPEYLEFQHYANICKDIENDPNTKKGKAE